MAIIRSGPGQNANYSGGIIRVRPTGPTGRTTMGATGRPLNMGSGSDVNAYNRAITDIQGNQRVAAQDQYNREMALAEAEVNADAAEYEAQQNRAAGQQAFQFALSQAGSRRTPGGGIARGGYGRRGATLGQATGGLAAANAAARRRAMGDLARARVDASPSGQSLRNINRATGGGMPTRTGGVMPRSGAS